jgi:acyl carrier protein
MEEARMPDEALDGKPAITPDEVALRVRSVVAESLELDVEEVSLTDSLFELGAESLDMLDMAFMLEKEYRIQFPRTDILERAKTHFGEDALVTGGVVTDMGLKLMEKGMPELDPALLTPGLQAVEVARMITVGSFVRITLRLIEAKADFPMVCPQCSGRLEESTSMPEFVCTQCEQIVPLPSGDEILLEDLLKLAREAGVDS